MTGRIVPFALVIVIIITQAGILHSQKATFYVSPEGNDNSAGTIEKPLRSFAGAVSRVKVYRSSHPGAETEVLFQDGEYFLGKQVILNKQVNNTTFAAAGGANPRFYASRKLTGWEKVSDSKVLEQIAPEARNKLLVLDLKKAGIIDPGDPITKGKRPDLFFDGRPQVLSRWPNSGFTFSGKAKGATPLSNTPSWYKAKGTVEGVFEYRDARIAKWAAEKDVCLNGYWFWDWAEQYHKVSSINTADKTITVNKPFHGYGYKDSCRYIGLNIFCETDMEGEYYINRETMKIYWYPPANFDPEVSDVRLSATTDSSLVSLSGCSNVRLTGLTISGGRGSAISVSGGDNCSISDCQIGSFGVDGIHIFGGVNHSIAGCLMNNFGFSGIRVIAGDRKNLILANHLISNNIIEYVSRFKHTYEPAVYFRGAGITISNNRLGHSPSSAMRLEGNEIVVEYNYVHNVVEESDDQGGIDTFYDPSYRGIVIRYNRWADIRGGTHNGAAGVRLDDLISGVGIYGNIFERCGAVIFGGVQIHGGKDNIVENNLFYDCNAAVSFSAWGNKRYTETLDNQVIKKKIYSDVNIDSPVWKERYPELKGIRENPDRNTVRNNLAVNCKSLFLRENGKNILENNIYIKSSPEPIDHFLEKVVQSKYFPAVIPVEKIGVIKNRWTKTDESEIEAWITSPSGILFSRQTDPLSFGNISNQFPVIEIDTSQKYQEIDGFGNSLTGGSAMLMNRMDKAVRSALLRELFATDGKNIGISYLRISIGASDLSERVFSYDDVPAGQTDTDLKHFSIDEEKKDLIPVLKEILAINPSIKIMGSPWSAPVWMKTNGSSKGGSLKPEYFNVYANYFVRYIKAMKAEGITIDAITIQNEPLHPGNNPSMYMTAEDQAAFIRDHLGPVFGSAGIKTKIVVYDHNCDKPEYPMTIYSDPEASKYVDGAAFHLYGGTIDALSTVHNAYPGKNLYFTEQWVGAPGKLASDLGWHVKHLVIGATRNWSRNVLEWNMASDTAWDPHTEGGCNRCLGTITINGNTVTRNPAYYILAHCAKFVRPGSVRVASNMAPSLPNVAFKTPSGKMVLIVLNDSGSAQNFNILFKGRSVVITLDRNAVGTYVW